MTGYGEARANGSGLSVNIEVRTVNNRHLKLVVRGSDPYPMLEADIEKVVRRTVKRGTVMLSIRVERLHQLADYQINTSALMAYIQQVRSVAPGASVDGMLPGLLTLPGVAPEAASRLKPSEQEWPLVEECLMASFAKLQDVRQQEGQAMADELLALQRYIREQLDRILVHLPKVMDDYRTRLLERIRTAIASAGVTLEPEHLVRELALFADRTDVSEEVTRLDAHLVQFEDVIRKERDGPGRRLEFVVQEMGRETNTLGSKAGDVNISRHVVEIKATLEKIRELVQNIE